MNHSLFSNFVPVANLATDPNYWRAMMRLLELEKKYRERVGCILGELSKEHSFILVPGFLRDARTMMSLWEGFSRYWNVLVPPNLTKKDWFRSDARERVIGMTEELIEKAHQNSQDPMSNIIVVGHSLWGALWLEAARRSNHRVNGVVQIATPNSRAPIMDVPWIHQVPILKEWWMRSLNTKNKQTPPVLNFRTEQDAMILPWYQHFPAGINEWDIYPIANWDHYNVLYDKELIDLIVKITMLQFFDTHS